MTPADFSQFLATKTRSEIMQMLYQAERAVNAIYPTAKAHIELVNSREDAQKNSAKSSKNRTSGRNLLIGSAIITAVLAMIALWLLISESLLLFVLVILPLGFMALFTIIILFVFFGYISEEKHATARLQQFNSQIPVSKARLDQVLDPYRADLAIFNYLCPEECADPRYMRLFVSYFETGRADTLKEARAIFDEHLHRERMENIQSAQIETARAAMYAAQNAAAAAAQAQSAANQAMFEARYH